MSYKVENTELMTFSNLYFNHPATFIKTHYSFYKTSRLKIFVDLSKGSNCNQ